MKKISESEIQGKIEIMNLKKKKNPDKRHEIKTHQKRKNNNIRPTRTRFEIHTHTLIYTSSRKNPEMKWKQK